MSKIVADLLGVDKREFLRFIERLERVSNNPGVDVRLGAEIVSSVREKIRQLGLDPTDTAPNELYYALYHQFQANNSHFLEIVQKKKLQGQEEYESIASIANQYTQRDKCLSVTTAGIKRLLKSVPPKKTMKLLGLRSIESVVKRQDPQCIYSLALILEDKTWRQQIYAKMRRLNAIDFSWQSVSVRPIPYGWMQKIEKQIHKSVQILPAIEAGVICVVPKKYDISFAQQLQVMIEIFHVAQIFAIESTPYFYAGFLEAKATSLMRIVKGERPTLDVVHGLQPNWGLIYRLQTKGAMQDHQLSPEILEENMTWQSTEMKLAEIIPEMDFWVNSHYLGVVSEHGTVSFHILDVMSNISAQHDFKSHSANFLPNAVETELYMRYMTHDAMIQQLNGQFVKRLESSMIL